MPKTSLRARVRALYDGPSDAADRFRYALLAFDLLTIIFLVGTSFLARGEHIVVIDLVIGTVILTDVIARLWISRQPLRTLIHPYGIADILVVISLLSPFWGEGLAFLRVLRIFRALHSAQTIRQLREDLPIFRDNENTIRAAINLLIFMFFMTALTYQTQVSINPEIRNYVDALYFTVSSLTTTGYGDITLTGSGGKLLSVVIMIFGISLFLRLVQVVLRPRKVEHKCPTCGLRRHDIDAVHCKACGVILNIEDDGVE